MSKYKPYGKSKSSGRGAGNQFDKLLKACSNSKGALGRFGGGTHFGSSRTCLDSTGEDEQTEKTSRFSSLNKRPRLDFASAQPINTPTSLHYASSLQSSINDPYSRIPVASTSSSCIQQTSAPPPPLQTVLKPRKFFKSRGPIEVEVDPNNAPKPLVKLDASPTSFNSNPILGSNQAININNSHSISSYYQNNNSKELNDTSLKSSKLPSSPPENDSSKSFSTVCSPPIKLRIIKDKTTSKFVSVPDATPSPVSGDTPQFPESQHVRHHGKKPKKKGRERKAAAKNSKVDTDDDDDEQLPVLLKAASKYKSRKGAKEKKPPKLSMPSPPRRTSGRITRSSIRHNDDSLEEEDASDPSMSVLGQENLAGGVADQLYNPPAVALRTSMESEATLRKLEEDAEFLKLSQMLSSMEEENSSSTPNSQPVEPSATGPSQHPNYYNSSLGGLLPTASSNTSFSDQQGFGNEMSSSYHPVNTSGEVYSHNMQMAGGCSESESESSKSYKNIVSPPTVCAGEPSSSGSFDRKLLPPEKKDIRSILEDDWNDSYDDDSPKKAGSPPKVSRFDASAFSTNKIAPREKPSPLPDDRDSDSSPILDIDYSNTAGNRREYSSDIGIQRPIPVYGNQFMPNMNQPLHQQQPPFNINTSPYAMRNLLGGPLDGRLNPPETSSGEAVSSDNEPQNLVCTKITSDPVEDTKQISVDTYSDFGSQNTLTSDSNMDSQGTNNLGGSQESSSSILTNSQSSSGPNLTKSSTSFKKASIFKSRAAKAESNPSGLKGQGESNKKRLAVYKHTFGQQDKLERDNEASTASSKSGTLYGDFEDEFEDDDNGPEDDDPNLKLRRLKITNSQGGIGGYSSKFSAGSGEDEGVNKVTCKKEVKRLFTVVRNVKAGHELQESGEFHEFDGDVWYILEDLKDKNPMTSRCLSAITLATRCMDQAFRMHLRAHGTVAEFCQELHDAPQHPVLSLLAATVLFVLSQDRLNMDLDTESLKLILALIKSETENSSELNENSETVKNRQRVTDLCVEMKNRGHAKHLKLDKITASELALETLLYLTSKRAGEWVKHELRSLGGLDSIVDEVDSSFKSVKAEILSEGFGENVLERLSKIDRCLQVLQQVTFNHEDNQRYLMQVSTRDVENSEGQSTKVKCTEVSPNVFLEMFKFCRDHVQTLQVQLESTGAIREILFSVLRLLVNLSHDYRGIVLGSEIVMSMDGFLELALHSTFQLTSSFPDEKVFDLLMHSLCLLLNLVEYSKKNRNRILQASIRKNASGGYSIGDPHDMSLNDSDDSGVEEELPVLDALILMFLSRERSAKKEEQHTDNILTTGDTSQASSGPSSGTKDSQSSTKDSQDTEGNSVQDLIDKLIQTAGKHMENSLIAAYISLLIGYLVMDDPVSVEHIRISMPDKKFLPLMVVLKKLFNFMSITSSASGSTRGLKATAIALKFYAKADPASDEELKKIIPD